MKIVKTKIDGSKNINICLIADIHFYPKYNLKKFEKIINNIKDNKPNYICITGDIIDTGDMQYDNEVKYLYQFINDLSNITKVIISIGNHDITLKPENKYLYPDLMINTFKKIPNVIVLDNEKYIENNVCFIGYTQSYNTISEEKGHEMEVAKEVSLLTNNINESNYNILLSHNPLYVTQKEVYSNIVNFNKINLILSGHTHNGMLPNFLKTNNVFITPCKRFFKKNARGHFKEENVDVVVTGGIIKLSKTARLLHLFNFLFAMNLDYIIVSNNKNNDY